jgi:hypothetical protein
MEVKDVEVIVIAALRQAAQDFTPNRGKFLPFAENRIRYALAHPVRERIIMPVNAWEDKTIKTGHRLYSQGSHDV